ncbi:hypothetical protein, partial [Streptomyces cuspidosporus]|uniref:hypothetical protein n=1 Tax=Streptomyces cuspidosporus TaxID=66882 RepID=UPI0031FD3972
MADARLVGLLEVLEGVVEVAGGIGGVEDVDQQQDVSLSGGDGHRGGRRPQSPDQWFEPDIPSRLRDTHDTCMGRQSSSASYRVCTYKASATIVFECKRLTQSLGRSVPMPLALLALAIGAFGIGTTEFV